MRAILILTLSLSFSCRPKSGVEPVAPSSSFQSQDLSREELERVRLWNIYTGSDNGLA